jgi:hypothetical protein
MDEMSWRKRAGVLLSILVLTLMSLSINKARAGEQTPVLRARWTKHRYCHDQRQHDDILWC